MGLGEILVFIGMVMIGISGLWLLIAGFSESVLWGLALLFFSGIASLIFIFSHWDKAKGPVGLAILGLVLMFGGAYLGGLEGTESMAPAP